MLDFSVGGRPTLLDPKIFSNLRVLWMKSDMQIQIHIPSTVHLTSLEAYVDTLGLHFEDADVSCMNLANVNILHQLRWPAEGQVGSEQLQDALQKRGISLRNLWLINRLYDGQKAAAQYRDEGELTYIGLLGWGDIQHHFNIFRGAEERCICTMCWSCQKLGSLSRVYEK